MPRSEPRPPGSGHHLTRPSEVASMAALKSEEGCAMDRSSVTAREIILEIVRNMREGLEPLHYSTLPPSVYYVYIHSDDLDRLRGILLRIIDEARRALDAELDTLNRASLAERIKLA